MEIEVVGGPALERLNAALGIRLEPGRFRREVAGLHRVAGRPRSVAAWTIVDPAGRVAATVGSADFDRFLAEGAIRLRPSA
jgi:hypothetical protein